MRFDTPLMQATFPNKLLIIALVLNFVVIALFFVWLSLPIFTIEFHSLPHSHPSKNPNLMED